MKQHASIAPIGVDGKVNLWENDSLMRADDSDLVSVEKLCKNFGPTRALSDLSFRLGRGETLGFLGPNGAGKTTAIHILLGLLAPTSGEVSVLGLSPQTQRSLIAERLNFASAYASLPTNLKVGENLSIYARIYNVKNPVGKIADLLELFEIAHLRNRVTGALSSGEKTRLGLAKALLNDPELLLLDEPTSSLDPDIADKVRRSLKKIQDKTRMGILYTSHNMPEVEEVCDRIIFIHRGRAIAEGTPETILDNFQSETMDQVFIKIVRSGDLIDGEG